MILANTARSIFDIDRQMSRFADEQEDKLGEALVAISVQ